MKKLLLLLLFTLFGYTQDYETQWHEIENLEQQNLPKSALDKVQLLYEKAQKDKNETQFIKALLYQEKYLYTLNEEGYVGTIQNIEKALKQSPTHNTKLILTSILAQLYSTYLDNNRYNLQERTPLTEEKNKDIKTWSIEKLLNKASTLYLESLNPKAQEISINAYTTILSENKNTTDLRPTLYDFLAFRALEYFNNERNYLTEPVYAFELKDKEALGSLKTFMNHHFNTKDKTSFKYQTLRIYQKLLQFHYTKKEPKALEHINLERLLFVYKNFHAKERDGYYLETLKKMVHQDAQSEALYYLALYHLEQDDYKQAMAYANRGIKTNNPYIVSQCQSIKNEILTQSLQLQIETVNLPNENILAKVAYRNSKTLFVKVIKVNTINIQKLDTLNDEKKEHYINTLPILNQFHLNLPPANDYKRHTTEISLGAYDVGQYLFVLSTDETFTKQSIFQLGTISNIAYMQQGNDKLLIINRKSGKAFSNVKTSFYVKAYNSKTNKSETILYSSKISNIQGFIDIPSIKGSYSMVFEYQNDRLDLSDQTYADPYQQDKKEWSRDFVHFFTDRAIYRPNQTIYFKGLAVESYSNKTPKILSQKTIEVTFYNTNQQKIETQTLTTDAFGTFNGHFTAPKSGLLGSMYLSADIGGETYIQVEEYKRPKFETTLNPLNKSYKLGDKITITGVAKAYAGDPIAGAGVHYTVTQVADFPWMPYWKPMPITAPKQLASGQSSTDKNGAFTFDFEALPDNTLSPIDKPNYRYQILVDVTDSTGESHTQEKTIQLGYVSIKAEMLIDEELQSDNNNTLMLQTTNLDDEFQPLKGNVIIEKIKKEEQVYRNRYWQQPDMPLYSKAEFEQLFSNYRYDEKEKNLEKTPIETLMFDTNKSKILNLNHLEQGTYLLTLQTTDEHGVAVDKQKLITVYDNHATEPPFTTYLWQKSDKTAYDVDDTAILTLKSSLKDIPILLTIERDEKIIEEKWLNITDVTKELIQIREQDRGNLYYQLNFIQDNRAYHQEGTLTIPWDNELTVEYISFRDKLKPNEEEQWKIKISGKDKERVMAQMVATLYDASLDALIPHQFTLPNLYPYYTRAYDLEWSGKNFDASSITNTYRATNTTIIERLFSHLQWLEFIQQPSYRGYAESDMMVAMPAPVMMESPRVATMVSDEVAIGAGNMAKNMAETSPKKEEPQSPVAVRKNLNETIFFKPNLQTDEEGNILIDFKTNEALSRWNFLAFVHTKDLKTAITQKSLTTQKELMVVSNLPRFFREKDQITLSTKVVNMSDKNLTGECELQLINPLDGTPIFTREFKKTFKIAQKSFTLVTFDITVPDVDKVPAIQHILIAKTQTHSDAEQVIVPILSNRLFVTESQLLSVPAESNKTFTLESLKNNHSTTLNHHKLTLEFTSNPAWYAVQSLPYLMEYPHECSEQRFARYYANALASKIANSTPKIKAIFESWKHKEQLKSNLSSNEELKSVLLEETPWVLDAQSQEEQQQNIALLFDLHQLAKEKTEALTQLKQRQLPDGGWAWFEGGEASWYITQYIVEGMGHLKKLGVNVEDSNMINSAIGFMDNELESAYQALTKSVEENRTTFKDDHLSSMVIHYLYARSFFKNSMSIPTKHAYDYYIQQAKNHWKDKGLYEQGMIALALHQTLQDAKPIVASLKERAIINDELGAYFKYENGYHWNQLPIETHALMIEVFSTITQDKKMVEQLKTWLLRNKQTTHWNTTKATSSAIYALLSDNAWLVNEKMVTVSFDSSVEYQTQLKKAQDTAQKGTGYFKVDYDKFDASMATVKVSNPNKHPAWGSLYWQYFENMNKIKSFKATPLTIHKKLFRIQQSDQAEVLSPITKQPLNVGDKVKVRIEIKVDRAMEYVMLKDSRASTFEPINVLSGYKYQDGLGYYESTKDNATYFFIDSLPKGTYVFEYPLFVTHKGVFSNGVTTIESMYAPEFKSHSEGVNVSVQ